MHRPLRVPFHLRVWHLIRGLLFYNTVYWRRASDGLNLPTLSAEERERQRPERNLEIIRPRVRPRAHIDAAKGGEISHPPILPPAEGLAEAPPATPTRAVEPAASRPVRPEVAEDGTPQVYVKRRRYRRRASPGAAADRTSFVARVFGKK